MPGTREHIAKAVGPVMRRELLAAAAEGRISHSPAGIMRRFVQPKVIPRRCDSAVRTLVAEGLLEFCPDGTVRPTRLPQRTRTAVAEQLHEGPDVDTLLRIHAALSAEDKGE